MSAGFRVAVVGATGAVGRVLLEQLGSRAFPAREIVPFASERSVGMVIEGLTVQPLTPETIQGFDIALFSAGGRISGEWAPSFAAAGATVIDNSSFWRMEDDVPLVVPEVNPNALAEIGRGIVANPNCCALPLTVALKPIHDAVGIDRVVVSTYQATSGSGQAAVKELKEQTAAAMANQPLPVGTVYHHQIAFNALPYAGKFAPGEDHTDEELKLINETRKILDLPTLPISATCVRVPVLNGHSLSVNVELGESLTADRAREILHAAPGITVVDDPHNNQYPMAITANGRDDVLVGRIRKDPSHPRGLALWIVTDNLRKGAATNALQIAELLHAQHQSISSPF